MLAQKTIDPEAEPLARGAVAHQALAETLEGLRERTGSARLTQERLPLARELLALALAEGQDARGLSVAPERLPAARRRLHADLERFLAYAAANPGPFEPSHLEVAFGFEGEGEGEELPALDLGRGVRLRGRIDRIDVGGGRALLYDYKNRRVPAPNRWLADGNLQVALYMRAAEQLLGLDVIGGFYQPISGEALRARGVLEEDSALELECTRGDERPAEEVRELVDQLVELALAAAAEAGAGGLEPRSRSCGFGDSGCQYPTICRCER
jgi:ATP-dependent helicase/DNAse subunit B